MIRQTSILTIGLLSIAFNFVVAVLPMSVHAAPSSGARKTVCSMALNSTNEFEAFRRELEPQGFEFVELVPERSDGAWFEKACRSGVRCDVLLVSGHFGGLFFGESKSNLLELSQLESASCSRSCDGILKNPKEVFLLGCNTLANHTRDHRTLGQYLEVLINDGFPLGFAEEVAVARYGGEGLSLEERFSHLFGEHTSIYGFASTGPVGSRAAPVLTKYLRSVGDYQRHLDAKQSVSQNLKLKSAFAKTSYKELLLNDRLTPQARNLVCKLQSQRPSDVQSAIKEIEDNGLQRKFIDRIRDTMASDLGPKFLGIFPRILDELSNSVKRNSALFEVQFKNIKAMIPIAANGDRRKLELSMQHLIDLRLSKAQTFIEVQRLCETGLNNNSLTLDHETFQKIPAEKHLKFVLIGCFSRLSDELIQYATEALSNTSAKGDQEYLYFNLRNHLSENQRQRLHSMKGFTDSVNADLKRFAEIPADYRQCLNSASRQVSAANRDAARWNCWQRMLPDSDLACLATMDQMEQQSSKDFAWQCAKRPETTVGRCLSIATLIPGEFEQMHDDLIWNCYSTLLDRMNLEKASCLMLQRSMRIRGHRIKMQWNCMNRLPK